MYQGKFSKNAAERKDNFQHAESENQNVSFNPSFDMTEKKAAAEGNRPSGNRAQNSGRRISNGSRPVQDFNNLQFAPQMDFPMDDSDRYIPTQEIQQPAPVYKRNRKAVWIGGIFFYVLLIAGVMLFYGQTQRKLDGMFYQLQQYETAQPGMISSRLFDELFANPDWRVLFDNSQTEISEFEGKDVYAAYMESKVGDETLTYRQTSTFDREKLEYGVYLKKEKIASFTIENHAVEQDVPEWKFDCLQLFVSPDETFKIQNLDSHTVKINGVVLGDGYLLQKDGFKVLDESLGELGQGLIIPSHCVHEISGLLMKPNVTIEDAQGNLLEVLYDEETRTFYEPEEQTNEVPADAKDLGLNTVRTYCEFMIKKAGRPQLAKYFNQNTDSYRAITSSDLTWIQTEKAHGFANETVSDYIKLNGDAFAVHVSLTWQLTRQDDSVKESPVDVYLIFEKDKNNDKWLCTRMTGMPFTEPYKMVRVRFMQDGKEVTSKLVSTDAASIQCPKVLPPEGAEVRGWLMQMMDENNEPYYRRVLIPDEEGNSQVPADIFIEPVDLRPVYTKK